MTLKTETKRMLMTINLLAVAIVLDLIVSSIPGLNLSMPFGGKFFGLSMFPLVLIGILFGLKYGLIGGFIYALYNFGFDYLVYLDTLRITLESWTGETWSAFKILSLVLLDYVIPFMAFGLAGLFGDALRSKKKLALSLVFVSAIRLISSTLSGIILWGSSIAYASSQVELGEEAPNLATRIFAFVGESLWLYSLSYNFIYIFTTTLTVMIISFLTLKRIKMIFEPMIGQPLQK
ncbi:MAG: hypothetical protein A2Y45_09820 [Tenericutes bacterium GWC2_34_14]|nr:MAG: hypothetical protein A2Y45_09820 [Tenericutes bacterium GWC2_34_14]OHE34219.1 MAG: hypothetical protein A2012_05125 [Tenericutes bacterium GWE2_34_108]OHE35550.1 MAG: hypothetical protein A2Y46_05490 [Tenericutes bacterium GWF1_35_14]OHE38531.1 MAG: hypothetical protein A2Y44_03980 [Tenericutes bacterium GWF2_35_184]OHE41589.1 MAG: hypothetical protein A3K26_08085 [Tenericutes bacterium RIFOXYA12_FULL_35_10]OHE43709.1 MAG: hypothetical protein A2221_00095 [Tenericutes bacterium RIFOXYA